MSIEEKIQGKDTNRWGGCDRMATLESTVEMYRPADQYRVILHSLAGLCRKGVERTLMSIH